MNDETKDLTAELSDSEKLDLLLRTALLLDTRVAKLEAFVEDRSRDTRPKLELIHKEIADTREEFRVELGEVKSRVIRIERKFDVLAQDNLDIRASQKEIERRMDKLEKIPA
jgi:hypothetical protein